MWKQQYETPSNRQLVYCHEVKHINRAIWTVLLTWYSATAYIHLFASSFSGCRTDGGQ